MHALTQALNDRRAAENAIEEILKRDYAPGAPIEWTAHAGRTYSGIVVRNCYGDRLYVQNDQTRRSRFIRAYQIVAPVNTCQRPEGKP